MNRLDRGLSPTRLHNGSRDACRWKYETNFRRFAGVFRPVPVRWPGFGTVQVLAPGLETPRVIN